MISIRIIVPALYALITVPISVSKSKDFGNDVISYEYSLTLINGSGAPKDFKKNSKAAKDIEERFKNRFGIYIYDWMERAEKYRIKDSIK